MPALLLSVLCLFILLPVSKAYEIEDSVHFGKIASDNSSTWLDNDDNPNIVAATAYYYVSTSGFDAYPGTLALPWRTIQKAANTAIPGSTVYVRGGTYHERITVRISGSASAGYVTFQNYPNETAIIDGTGPLFLPELPGFF